MLILAGQPVSCTLRTKLEKLMINLKLHIIKMLIRIGLMVQVVLAGQELPSGHAGPNDLLRWSSW